ncbi:MAG: phosphomannomutase/phosphoglucomutase [Oscillospiraceae bacterium]|nr:phosphomannomutase/phosphoglucomutase [Oscillospiraceae bacterium]
MLGKYWKHFKSGTDIRGVAVDAVKDEPLDLTDENVFRMTAAFAKWLRERIEKDNCRVSVGHDSRISAERIKKQVISALTKSGFTVVDCSLASTPAMFMTTVDLGCDAAVQITASHHPYHRNGLKFFTRQGGLEGSDIEAILEYAQNEENIFKNEAGEVVTADYMSQYAANLRSMIKKQVNADDYEHPLKGYKIAVDAGNGVGGFFARDVLSPLGADTSMSRYLEPDGMFPNHIPNPENPAAMQAICEATLAGKADLGVIFDTDVDRAGCVDANGKEINRNRLVALASAIALEGNEGGTVVTDSVTSSGLKKFIEQKLGGVHYRYKRGYKNVIDRQIELNESGVNCPLAMETSGHAAFRENYYLDDGAYLMMKIIIKMAQLGKQGRTIDSLIAELEEPAEAQEFRFRILAEDFRAYGEKVIKELERYAQSADGWLIADDNREGVRVNFGKENGDGWFLLRLSVHDPIMPLNIESDSAGGVRIIAGHLLKFLENYDGLDITAIKDFLK